MLFVEDVVVRRRSFTARPIFSTDDPNVDKHKLERFLHDRRQCMATIYGPIQYPPLPLLAFKINPDHPPQLALAGQQTVTRFCILICDQYLLLWRSNTGACPASVPSLTDLPLWVAVVVLLTYVVHCQFSHTPQ